MSDTERDAALAELLVHLSETLSEGAEMAVAQRDGAIELINAYQRLMGDRQPVDLAGAALILINNEARLSLQLRGLADQVGSIALQLKGGGK